MSKLKLIAVMILTIACITQASHAQESSGWYAGLSVGNAYDDFDLDPINVDESFVLGAQLGFRWDYAALELKYRNFDGFDLEFQGVTGEIEAWTASLRGKLYMGENALQPYALLGIGIMDAEFSASFQGNSASISANDLFLEVGLGLEYKYSDRLGLFIEASYLIPEGDLDGLDTVDVALGFNIHF